MDIQHFETLVVSALEDIKGKDIRVIDTTRLTSLFDRVIIATADSNRQTRALARHVADKAREAGIEVVGIEGEGGGEWVLVDLEGGVVGGGEAGHRQPVGAGGAGRGPVGRLAGGDQAHPREAQGFAGGFGEAKVAVVDRVEGAAQDTDGAGHLDRHRFEPLVCG